MDRIKTASFITIGALSLGFVTLLLFGMTERKDSQEQVSLLIELLDRQTFRYSAFGKSVRSFNGASTDGTRIDSSFFSGKRATILAFLSENACKVCAESEVAIWDTLLQKYPKRLGIVLVMNYPERERILRLIKEYKFHYPIINEDVAPLFKSLNVTVTPRVFLVNSESKVLLQHFTRPADDLDLRSFYRLVDTYLQ